MDSWMFPEESVLALLFFDLPFSSYASFIQSDNVQIDQFKGNKICPSFWVGIVH